jgi:hypothetical protein
MSQQVEYANMHTVMADEMTRNWIEVKSRKDGDEDIDLMEQALVKYDVKRLIHEAVKQDSMFGVAHIYVDTGASETELEKPLFLDPRKIPRAPERPALRRPDMDLPGDVQHALASV